jgi:CheY-like chemotaxis protein
LVAVTGWGQESDRLRAHDAGFDAHLTKPAEPDDILAALGTAERV